MPINFKMTRAACQAAAETVEKFCSTNNLTESIWLKRLPALTGFRYDNLHHHTRAGRITRANPGQYPIAVTIPSLINFLKNHDAETLLKTKSKSKLIKPISVREQQIKTIEMAIRGADIFLKRKLPDWQRKQYIQERSKLRRQLQSHKRRLRKALARSMQHR